MNNHEMTTKGYGLGILTSVEMGPAIVEYLERIDATLEPFGGRFVLHGGKAEVLEGTDLGDVILIEFPDVDHARRWYASPAYREILPLRTENAVSTVVLLEGVDEAHRATDVLAAVR